MIKFAFILFLLLSCNQRNKGKEIKENLIEPKSATKKLSRFYESDKIEHFYLNISEDSIFNKLIIKNKTKNQSNFIDLLTDTFPGTISETNFESILFKNKFIKTELSYKKKMEVENIFSQKDSSPNGFASCVPYFRDIFIFKRNDSIVGISKICFDCGISQFIGSKVDTEGFGLGSELNKLKNIVRNK